MLSDDLAACTFTTFRYFSNPKKPMDGTADPIGWLIRWLPEAKRNPLLPLFKQKLLMFEPNILSLNSDFLEPVMQALMEHYQVTDKFLLRIQSTNDKKGKEAVIELVKEWESAKRRTRK